MRDFLNDFAADGKGKITKEILIELGALFRKSMEIIYIAKKKIAFRPVRALNAAVFEAVAVGVAERLRSGSGTPDIAKISEEYDILLRNPDFLKASDSATATEESVKTRQRLAVEAFKNT